MRSRGGHLGARRFAGRLGLVKPDLRVTQLLLEPAHELRRDLLRIRRSSLLRLGVGEGES